MEQPQNVFVSLLPSLQVLAGPALPECHPLGKLAPTPSNGSRWPQSKPVNTYKHMRTCGWPHACERELSIQIPNPTPNRAAN